VNRGEYDPSRQSPYRGQPQASPQYTGAQYAGYGSPPQPQQGHPGPGGYSHPHYWAPGQQQPLRQSGMGLASFILAILSGVLLVVSVVAAGVLATRSGGTLDEKSVAAMAAGLGIILGLVMNLVGTVLGIVALMQRDRKKVFAILGLTFNVLLLLMVGGLMIVGLAAKP
jgi:hypothetical protein